MIIVYKPIVYESIPLISNGHNSVLGKVFRSWENLWLTGPNVLEYLADFRKVCLVIYQKCSHGNCDYSFWYSSQRAFQWCTYQFKFLSYNSFNKPSNICRPLKTPRHPAPIPPLFPKRTERITKVSIA